MDALTASLVALAILLFFVLALSALRIVFAHFSAKQATAQRMLALAKKSVRARARKSRDDDDEDDDEEDGIDELLDQLEPYQQAVAGFVQAKGVPIDVEALFNRDPKEKMKAAMILEQVAAGKGAAAKPAIPSGPAL